jgi:hypothetical protein
MLLTRKRIAILLALACIPLGSWSVEEGNGPGEMSVEAYGVGTGVVDRELEGEASQFAEGDKVWFWTRVVGGRQGDRIEHVWLRDGEEMLTVGLVIGGSHWRTWSNKLLHPGSGGAWAVEARDATGNVLARAEFACD